MAVHFLVGKVGAEGQPPELREVGPTPTVKEIKDGEQVPVTFQYTFPEPGDYVIRVEVDHDGLEADDARRVVVTVKDRVEVLLVDGKPAGQAFDRAAEYVRTALNPFQDEAMARENGVVARPKVINETQFADEGLGDLTPYDCVFLCDVPLFTDGEAHRLLNHVRRGGGVVFVAGDRVDLKEYNATLSPSGVGLLPVRLIEKQNDDSNYSYQLTPESDLAAEPAFRPFTDSRPREMLQAAHFHSFLRVEPAVIEPPAGAGATAKAPARKTAAAHTLLSFTPVLLPGKDPSAVRPPGGPAVLEWRPPASGKDAADRGQLRGRVVLVTTTLNADWNSWPASPVFPPFIDRLMHFAAAGRLREQSVEVGDAIELFLPNSAGGSASVHTPDGRDESAPIRQLDDGGVLRWSGADVSGLYRISAAERRRGSSRRRQPAGPQRLPAGQFQRPGPRHDRQLQGFLSRLEPPGRRRFAPGDARPRRRRRRRGRADRPLDRPLAAAPHARPVLRRSAAGVAVRPLHRRGPAGGGDGSARHDAPALGRDPTAAVRPVRPACRRPDRRRFRSDPQLLDRRFP